MYCGCKTQVNSPRDFILKRAREPKDDTLTIRIRPSIKAKAVQRAEEEDRSIANYIERLIEDDWAKKRPK